MRLRNYFWIILLLLTTGCDFAEYFKAEKKDNNAGLQQQQQPRAAEERQEVAQKKFEQYIAGRISLTEAELKKDNQLAETIKQDISLFSSKLSEIQKDAGGDSHSREKVLCQLLQSPAINDLARKYQNMDYALVFSRFRADAKSLANKWQKYHEAIANQEKWHAENLGEIKKWTSATQQQRDAEIDRIRAELKDLVSKRDKVLEEMRMKAKRNLDGAKKVQRDSDTLKPRRIEYYDDQAVLSEKLADLDQEIRKKRTQIDYFRNPETRQRQDKSTLSDVQASEQRAAQALQKSLRDIDQRLKPKETINDIVEKYENQSIGVLQTLLSDQYKELQARIAKNTSKLNRLKELKLTIPIANQAELQKIKNEALKL